MRFRETKGHEISCNSTFHKTCLRLCAVNVMKIKKKCKNGGEVKNGDGKI